MIRAQLPSSIPEVEGVSHRFVGVNGIKMHLAEAGEGEPLLLLHGWPQHWYMWRYQIPHFARKYRVVCPDLRGAGWSDAPEGNYEKERLVDDIIALLDVLQIERVRLVGHDWGGWIGFLLCLRRPDLVDRYLALNIIHPFQRADARLLQLWRFWYQWVIASPFIGKWVIQNRPGIVGRMMASGTVNKVWSEDELRIYTSRLQLPEYAYASVLLYRSFVLREFLPIILGRYRSQRLTTPTKILFGADDFAISTELLKGYERNADDLQIEFVEQCGHFIAEDRPDLVTERALEFFAS
jgi:pimeloyl-ACP methyl ester carboxylesterase